MHGGGGGGGGARFKSYEFLKMRTQFEPNLTVKSSLASNAHAQTNNRFLIGRWGLFCHVPV